MSNYRTMSKKSAENYLEWLTSLNRLISTIDDGISKEFGVSLCGLTYGIQLHKGIKNLSDALGIEPVMSSLDKHMRISIYYKGIEVFELIGSKEKLIEEGLYTEEEE